MRLVLALALFLGSLGVATSGRAGAARVLHVTAAAGDGDGQFAALVDAPLRWTPPPHRQRALSAPTVGKLVDLTAPPNAPHLRWCGAFAVFSAPALRDAGSGACPSCPRAPPRGPVPR